MTTIPQVTTITVLGPGQEAALDFVRKNTKEKVTKLDRIEVDPELGKDESRVDVNEKTVLKAGKGLAQKLFSGLKEEPKLQGQENTAYVEEPTDKYLGFTEHEEDVQNTLRVVSDILHRAFHRRTSITSWILLLTLRVCGFSSDDFEPVKKILTFNPDPNDKESSKDFVDFVKKYARYVTLKEYFPDESEKFIQESFKDDEKKLGLVKLVSFVTRVANKLPVGFVNNFPVIFAIQNLAMPLLANFTKGKSIGKFFNFIRMINPWIGDFFAEQVGNFKNEILQTKECLRAVNDPFKSGKIKTEFEEDKDKIIDGVNITDLDKEQFSLKKVAMIVNNAFDRLFGRQTTVSSWILNLALRFFGKQKDYQAFANKFIEDDDFIKNLHEHFEKVRESTQNKEKEPELSKEKFDGAKRFVAGIFYGIVSIANALSEKFIKNSTNVFGLAFSLQNLFMPIVAEFVTEGKKATFIHLLRDVNPILNDVLDYVANYRQEILEVQKENKEIKQLLPTLSWNMVLDKVFGSLKLLGSSIMGFSRKVFGKA